MYRYTSTEDTARDGKCNLKTLYKCTFNGGEKWEDLSNTHQDNLFHCVNGERFQLTTRDVYEGLFEGDKAYNKRSNTHGERLVIIIIVII